MIKFIVICFLLNFYTPAFSSSKEEIISQMQLTDNLSFNFIQTIDDKNENGKCIIKYPKKFGVNMTILLKKLLSLMENLW